MSSRTGCDKYCIQPCFLLCLFIREDSTVASDWDSVWCKHVSQGNTEVTADSSYCSFTHPTVSLISLHCLHLRKLKGYFTHLMKLICNCRMVMWLVYATFLHINVKYVKASLKMPPNYKFNIILVKYLFNCAPHTDSLFLSFPHGHWTDLSLLLSLQVPISTTITMWL